MKLRTVLSISFKVLGIFIFVLLPFIAGLIHPFAVFWYYASIPLLLPLSGIILIVFFIIFLSLIYKPTKEKFKRYAFNLCLALLFFFSVPACRYTSFAGLIIHYELFGDFKAVRVWAENLNIHKEVIKQLETWSKNTNISEQTEIFYDWSTGLPEPASNFHPMYVSMRQTDNQRKTIISWSSGLMKADWSLVILSPETSELTGNWFLTYKIEPGVYLCFY